MIKQPTKVKHDSKTGFGFVFWIGKYEYTMKRFHTFEAASAARNLTMIER